MKREASIREYSSVFASIREYSSTQQRCSERFVNSLSCSDERKLTYGASTEQNVSALGELPLVSFCGYLYTDSAAAAAPAVTEQVEK